MHSTSPGLHSNLSSLNGFPDGATTVFKTCLALLWCVLCTAGIISQLPQLDPRARQQLLFYLQPLLPVLLMLWLWTANVHTFVQQSIDYEACFSAKDRKLLPTQDELGRLGLAVAVVLLTCSTAFVHLARAQVYWLCDYFPPALYGGLVLLVLLAPSALAGRQSRLFFASTLRRVLLPLQEVTWADFLLADMLCSLSWTTYGLSRAACSMVAEPPLQVLRLPEGQAAPPSPPLCGPLSPPMMVGLCLPYIIRFIQCCIVYRTTGRVSQLFNALKYCTAYPALVLGAHEHEAHIRAQPFLLANPWLVAQLVNSLYSAYWDVEFDWDMPWLIVPGAWRLGPLRFPALKAGSLFSTPWYVWLVVSNLLLRMTWTHRLVGDLEAHEFVALAIAGLEVVRRHQWTYVRVESELRKVHGKQVHGHHEALLPADGDGSSSDELDLQFRSAIVTVGERIGEVDLPRSASSI